MRTFYNCKGKTFWKDFLPKKNKKFKAKTPANLN